MKFALVEVVWRKEQREEESERWASARSYRVLKVMVKGLGFYIRETGGYSKNFDI